MYRSLSTLVPRLPISHPAVACRGVVAAAPVHTARNSLVHLPAATQSSSVRAHVRVFSSAAASPAASTTPAGHTAMISTLSESAMANEEHEVLPDYFHVTNDIHMEHDYICHLLARMFRAKGLGFLTAEQIIADEALHWWFGGTPDFVLRGNKKRATGTYIIDVHTDGKNIRQVKKQYNNSMASPFCEQLLVLHPLTMADRLNELGGGVFDEADIKDFMANYHLLEREAHYSQSGLKEHHKIELKPIVPHPLFEQLQYSCTTTWKTWALQDLDKLKTPDASTLLQGVQYE